MKQRFTAILISGIMVSQIGCASSPNRAAEGGIIGGLLGAGAGAIIGNQANDRDKGRTQGALIGGAIGALGGALAGSQVQKQPVQQQAAAGQEQANLSQLPLSQIVELSRQGVHEDVIIDRIRLTNSIYRLSPTDIEYLRQNGVSQKVLMEMQSR
jgi:uncharacterized protein YcfJ